MDTAQSDDNVHGLLGRGRGWASPVLVTDCGAEARPGYQSCSSHEYSDEPAVLREKMRLVADLVRKSRRCVTYTGAGLSTAAGIADYATQAGEASVVEKSRAKVRTPWEAKPTSSHHILRAMHHAGYLQYFVQQNHDGLPQKAGFPQSALNEIHGSWYDPANPRSHAKF